MSVTLVVPKSVRFSAYHKFRWGAIGLGAHTLQSGQRWVFLLRVGRRRLAYRTSGDAKPSSMTYHDAGWYWPWKVRTCSGRG